MEVPLIEQFGQVEPPISGTIFFGPVEFPLIESSLILMVLHVGANNIANNITSFNRLNPCFTNVFLLPFIGKFLFRFHDKGA